MIIEEIAPGSRRDVKLQCREAYGPAAYQASDVLSAAVWQDGIDTAAVAAATAAWWTDPVPGSSPPVSRQAGYPQGQVLASIPSAESRKLTPTVPYTLRVTRAMGVDPTQSEEIATVRLVVRRPSSSY